MASIIENCISQYNWDNTNVYILTDEDEYKWSLECGDLEFDCTVKELSYDQNSLQIKSTESKDENSNIWDSSITTIKVKPLPPCSNTKAIISYLDGQLKVAEKLENQYDFSLTPENLKIIRDSMQQMYTELEKLKAKG